MSKNYVFKQVQCIKNSMFDLEAFSIKFDLKAKRTGQVRSRSSLYVFYILACIYRSLVGGKKKKNHRFFFFLITFSKHLLFVSWNF